MILLAIVNGQPREAGFAAAAEAVHRAPHRSGAAAHAVRAAQGRRARAHPCSVQESARAFDDIIKLIPPQQILQEAREGLIETWEFSERQAQAILDLQLHRLTQLEREKILEELKQIQTLIAELKEILGSEKKLRS